MSIFRVPRRSGSFRGAILLSAAALALAAVPACRRAARRAMEIRHAAVAQDRAVSFHAGRGRKHRQFCPGAGRAGFRRSRPCRRGRPICSARATSSTSRSTKPAFRCSGRRLGRAAAGGSTVVDTSSTAERLPPVRVDDYGYIKRAVRRPHARAGPHRRRIAVDDPERPSRHVAGPAGDGHDRAVDHQQHHPCRRSDAARAAGARDQPRVADRRHRACGRLPGRGEGCGRPRPAGRPEASKSG